MAEDGKKAAIGLGVVGVVGVLIYAATRAKAAPPPPGAEFVASNLIIEPSEVNVGEQISISATVTNIGTEAGTYEVIAEIVGVTTLRGTGVLSPGESERGTLYFTPTQPGTYQVLLNGLSGSFVAIEVAIGFTLRIINAPAGAVLWNANFAENAFKYDPIADSGWLGIGESWIYPSDPKGCTTLLIWILDTENNILLDVYNLGPVNDGIDYIYDCATGILYS